MVALNNHIIAYTDGSADNAKTKMGGYGIFLNFKNKEKKVSKKVKTKTSNNKMEIKAVTEVFNYIKSTNFPLVIVMDSDYVYNCATGNWKIKKNKKYWDKFADNVENFKKQGGKVKLFVVESHISLQNSKKIDENFKKFKDKNRQEDLNYLKENSKLDLKAIYVEFLKGNSIADKEASAGLQNSHKRQIL